MLTTPITIGFVPIARPTFDVELAQTMAHQAHDALEQGGYTVVGDASLIMDADAVQTRLQTLQEAPIDLLLLFQASFADATMAVELAHSIDAPLLLWAIPEARTGGRLRLNSFCGINLAGHGLTRRGIAYDYLYALPDDAEALRQLDAIARASRVRKHLQGTRIGRIGVNPDGFDTCLVDEAGLRQHLGVEVVQVALEEVFDRSRQVAPERVDAVLTSVGERVAGLQAVDAGATRGTLSAYVALEALADEQKLKGLAVRCWPEFFTELGCSACGAMSLLSDQHTPTSCEVDVNGTITQLILQWLSGEPAFGSDIVAFDTGEDVAILWHCGLAPLSMADPAVTPTATLHSNRQKPLLMQFTLKPGRVTLARLSEASGEFRLIIAGGEMLQAPPSFSGTSGTLRFDSGAQVAMDTLIREGLEHHLSLTYGDHRPALEALARMLKIPVLYL